MAKSPGWEVAMYAELLRADGKSIDDVPAEQRVQALTVLTSMFPNLKIARRALRALHGFERRQWTPEDRQLVADLYPHRPTHELARCLRRHVWNVYAEANRQGLKKTAEYLAGPDACRLRRGGGTGAAHRFPKGHTPHNKGVKGWASGGRSRETHFKPGHMPQTWQPVGTEVLDKDGYLKRKVTDDRSKPSRFNWRYVHSLLWEQHHGPVPEGHAVVFRDGDKKRIEISNLELISRAELMARNTIHNQPIPEELRAAIRQIAGLRRRITCIERKRADGKQGEEHRRAEGAPVPGDRTARGSQGRRARRRDPAGKKHR